MVRVLNLEHVLDQIERVTGRPAQRRGNSAQCLCPAHEDTVPSLTVSIGANGAIILHCFAGCATEAVLKAVGLTFADVFPPKSGDGGIPIRTRYFIYADADGTPLYRIVRQDGPRGKTIWQEHLNGTGQWVKGLADKRRVLYRLPDLLAAVAERREIFIPEGEPHCDYLWQHGLAATTNLGGAGKWRKEYGGSLKGARVIVLPDNDDPGRAHARDILNGLMNVARSVKMLELPDLPAKGDILDWKGPVDDLRALAEKTDPVWQASIRGRVLTAGEYIGNKEHYAKLVSYWADGAWNSSTINLLSATTEVGKSTFTLQAGISFAGGLQLLGLQTRPCRVLLAQTEVADRAEIERLEIMLDHMLTGLDSDEARGIREAVGENLFFRDQSIGFHLWATERADQNLPLLYLEELRQDIKSFQPEVLILDPYGKIFRVAGPWEIRAALERIDLLAEEFGLCILLVAHWNKISRGVTNPNLDQAFSGGAALVDDAASALNLAYVPRTPIAQSHAKLSFDKVRYRPPLDSLVLKRPTTEARFFQIDHSLKPDDVPDRKPLVGENELAEALRFCGPLPTMTLVREVMQRAGCSKNTATTRIREASDAGKIRRCMGKYEHVNG